MISSVKGKKLFIEIFKILLAGGILYWLIQSGKFDLTELKRAFNLGQMSLLVGVCATTIFIASERWRAILNRQGFKMSSFQTFKLTLVGIFFNLVMPGGVGGDLVKGYYVVKSNPNAKLKSALTIAIDRLLGLFSMVIMALFVLGLHWREIQSNPLLMTITGFLSLIFFGFVIFWVFTFSRRFYSQGWIQKLIGKLPLSHQIHQIYETFALYRDHKSSFFYAVFLSTIAQLFMILFFVVAGKNLGYSISFETYFFVVPIGMMVLALPISPAGIGVGQAAFLYLFNAATQSESNAGPTLITLYQASTFVVGLLGGFYYLRMGAAAKEKPQIPGREIR